MYDTRNSVDRLSAIGGWVETWMQQGGRGAVLCSDVATQVDMLFIRCTEEGAYASRLALIVLNGSELADSAPTTDRLAYAAFLRPFDSLHPMTNLAYWWKEL